MTYLKPGDIILTRGQGWISEAVRRFSNVAGENRAHVNHVGVVVSEGIDKAVNFPQTEAVIVEALTHVMKHTLNAQYSDDETEITIFRPKTLSDDQINILVQKANSYVGDSYGYIKIVAHLFDWCLGGVYFFRRLANMDKYPICSWVVAESYATAGHYFGVDPGAAAPEDIWFYCNTHPEQFELIRPLIKW